MIVVVVVVVVAVAVAVAAAAAVLVVMNANCVSLSYSRFFLLSGVADLRSKGSLRKVTDDMKTHKNPALRQGPAPFKATQPKPASPKPVAKPVAAAPAKPPLTELQGKKWVVEYHKDNKSIVIDKTELKQSLYAFKCEGCVIQVTGKINSIILDSCKKTAIVFDDLLASLEFVNCQSMQAQVKGKLPTVSIDKTDGCQVYLSKDSLDVEIVSAKSSEMNILVPQGDGDYKEFALPEQFKTKYDGKTMVTVCAESI
ncbi:adenylyl cyclase-associated protein [Elysia marginata]|uniref:Adenylyl cyclase-associated protein n=1 Tax=Elysia marginata TaxID=1093978 RepID=A0AAV4K2H8_9GAST|nr:adenylyl cyclase-associated protein [Elysia marginata]